METAYFICAVIGVTVIAGQFVLTLLGLGGDDGADLEIGGDGSHGHGPDWLFGLLTFRTIVAALAFFGLTGMILLRAGVEEPYVLAGAIGAGLAALVLVSWLMRGLTRLNLDGTFRLERAVGATGIVYLTIPGRHEGAGKVTVSVQGRRVECRAVTAHDTLPTGTRVVVTSIHGPDTIEVVPVTEQVAQE